MTVQPPPSEPAGAHFNRDVAWNGFDTDGYLADNYAHLHDFDRRIIIALSPYYRALPTAGLASSLDVGTGPNLYPLMLAAGASRRLEVLEHSAANVAYLDRVRGHGADPSWTPFWDLCRHLNPELPAELDPVLRGLTIQHGDAFDLPVHQHELVSMFFMAESVTGDLDEFQQLCHRFASAATPGGHLVAAFMAGMPSYHLGGQTLPSLPLDQHTLQTIMQPVAEHLQIWQLPADSSLPYRHEGVLLLTARTPHRRPILLP